MNKEPVSLMNNKQTIDRLMEISYYIQTECRKLQEHGETEEMDIGSLIQSVIDALNELPT